MREWQPVRRLCRELLDELPAISEAVTGFIRASIAAYAIVPVPEHRVAVHEQLRIRLTALSEGRPLQEAELAAAAELAAVRAAEGVPIDALIAAYQIGDQEVWRLIEERGGPGLTPLMPRLGGMILAATSATTTMMARAHSRVARDIDGGRITLAHQFLELLDDPAEHAEAALVGSRLSLDPGGDFAGLVWLPESEEPGTPHEAASSLRSESIDIVVRAVGEGRLEMIAQADDFDLLVARVSDRLVGGRLGIGLPRRALAGAAMSLADARIAVEAASATRPRVWFADHWLEALALAESERIRTLIQPGIDVARSQHHLAETVTAFAGSDMSIAVTAKSLHLHANSITYRLDRWAALTGMNPRTFEGLARSVIACRQADRDPGAGFRA